MSDEEKRQHRAANIPKHFADASLSDLNAALKLELQEIDDRLGLFCWGPVGIGKTHLLAALANNLLVQGAEIVWTTLEAVCTALRSVYCESSNRNEEKIFQTVLETEHLFLDDLGVGYADTARATDFTNRVLYRILDHRLHHGRLTFVSANKPPYEMEKHFDRRISSRLHMLHILPLTGKDRRKAEGRRHEAKGSEKRE